MASTFFGLNIGKTGLYAYQAALDTTAHNISNSETEGYSRQAVGLKASKALRVNSTYGMAGTGVGVTGVNQMRENYYDVKYWKNNMLLGEYSSKSKYMTEIENYFNDISVEGFTTSFNSMYDSLQELQKNPSSLTVRTQVINYAGNLTSYFRSVAENLKSIQDECNFEIRNQVNQINSAAQQIAALTKQIVTLEVGGGTANDLRDQRALLVDKLSQIANISVTEKTIGEGVGVNSYVVKIDGVTLVDGANNRMLKVVPRSERYHQNDLEGLYDVVWENGQDFNSRSATLGGSLRALFEVRDGNNQYNLQGMTTVDEGDTHVVLTQTNMNSIEKLSIPEAGVITVGSRRYTYTGFEVTKEPDTGNYRYTFELKEPATADAIDELAMIGESVNYKGVPYYMSRMNEFTRTFSKAFNEIHRSGLDLYKSSAMDVFSARNQVSGRDYTFGPLNGSDDSYYYDYDTFDSQTGGYYEPVPEDVPLYGSYYFMTAENFYVSKKLTEDPKLLATSTDVVNGTENNDVIHKLIALKNNKQLFLQGTPGGFFQTLVAEIGIDTSKANTFADSQTNILGAIKNQRLSISGVDIDEEAMHLVRYQNAYNLSAKVITVMDEIYDKLINYMGV